MDAEAGEIVALKRGSGAQTATGGPEWKGHAAATTASACTATRLDAPMSHAGPGRENTRQVAHVARYLSVRCRATTPRDECTAVSNNVIIDSPDTDVVLQSIHIVLRQLRSLVIIFRLPWKCKLCTRLPRLTPATCYVE